MPLVLPWPFLKSVKRRTLLWYNLGAFATGLEPELYAGMELYVVQWWMSGELLSLLEHNYFILPEQGKVLNEALRQKSSEATATS